MVYTPPPSKGQQITPEFLADLAQRAYAPMTGAGVHHTHLGSSVAPNIPIVEPVPFELKTSLTADTHTADAWGRYWNGTEWVTDDSSDTFTVEDVTESITATGRDDAGEGADGYFGWGMLEAISGAVLMVGSAGSALTPFELKDDIEPGGSAEAWACKDEGGYVVRDTAAAKLTVWDDMMSNVRALGSDTTGGSGAFGFAQNLYGYLQIVVCKQQAKMCYCQAKIASGNTLATVDHVVPMDGGQSPVASDTTELSVASGFETDNDAYGIIAWDETNGVWRPLDFSCPS